MIRPLTLAAALAAVAVTAVVLSTTAAAAAHPKLIGVVGKNDAYKITLSSNGKIAKTLKPGTYTFVIHDGSSFHDYELDGPNDKEWKFTSVGFVGTKTMTIKLVKGKYKAYCAPHESVMFQKFTVA